MGYDLTGKVFGKWRVIQRAQNVGSYWGWLCVCACGFERVNSSNNLMFGKTTQCRSCASRHHGGARDGRHLPEYFAWRGMRNRCYDSSATGYENYGGRGIAVCERWLKSFSDFYADMGPRPSPAHSLDRIDVNGNYEPGNCRWATRKEQARNARSNRLVVLNGTTMTMAELVERSGTKRTTIEGRLNRGVPVEQAILPPTRKAR